MTAATPNCSERRAERGFTLLELLLAVVILGLLTATVYGALARTLTTQRHAEERAELYSAGRQALLRIAGDIEAALPASALGGRIYFRGTHGLGEAPEIHLVAMNRGGYGFNRVRPGRVLIVYSLAPLPNRRGQYALLREEYLYKALLDRVDGIEQELDTSLFGEEEDSAPTEQASFLLECPDFADELDLPGTCTPVIGLTFRYFDEVVGDWREEWDDSQEDMLGRLPAAVEITLVLADENGGEHPFYTVVDLPLARGQPTPRPGGAADTGGDPDDDGEDEGEDDPDE